MFWFFDHEACVILPPWPGIEPATPALEGNVLTTGSLGKSPPCWFLDLQIYYSFAYVCEIYPLLNRTP